MKVLVFGGATIDTIAIIDSDRIERMSMRNADSSFLLLEEGRKTEALEISTHCGGGGVNAAVAMARLGMDASAFVKLGKDARADTIMARLTEEGVSTRWALRDGRLPTGASVFVSSHDRDAAIFTFRGANTLLEPGDLRDAAFEVDLVYIANLSNKSADCFPLIVRRAKERGALVATNPGVRQLSSRGRAFQECLGQIDILSMNRNEADTLVPSFVGTYGEGGPTLELAPGEEPPPLLVRGLTSGGFEIGLVAFFEILRKLGPKHVVLTDGARGAFAASMDEIHYCPPVKVEVAGTAGAGDAFSATFAACIALGRSAEEALRAAAINAGSVVGHVDTQSGLLRQEAIETSLRDNAGRLAVRKWPLDTSRPGRAVAAGS
jgi:ribokinase